MLPAITVLVSMPWPYVVAFVWRSIWARKPVAKASEEED